jgi:hypothetical protein
MSEGILAASRWEARVSELPGVRSRSSTEKSLRKSVRTNHEIH